MYCMSTTLSNKHLVSQLWRKSPAALGSDARPALVALSAPELLFPQLLDFKFQPKKGMRPMTKERIQRMAMISLAVFPVISSLYLEKDAAQATGLIISPAWRFWTRVTLKGVSVVLLVEREAGVGLLAAAHIILMQLPLWPRCTSASYRLESGRPHEASRDGESLWRGAFTCCRKYIIFTVLFIYLTICTLNHKQKTARQKRKRPFPPTQANPSYSWSLKLGRRSALKLQNSF